MSLIHKKHIICYQGIGLKNKKHICWVVCCQYVQREKKENLSRGQMKMDTLVQRDKKWPAQKPEQDLIGN